MVEYKRPIPGQPVNNALHKDIRTPKFKIKFSNLYKPFFYDSSPMVPRYSVTCVIDPDTHLDFIERLIALETREGITEAATLKDEVFKNAEGAMVATGKHLMKFQSKDRPTVIFPEDKSAQLTRELVEGDEVIICFDIVRYNKKNPNGPSTKGLSYQPKTIFIYPTTQVSYGHSAFNQESFNENDMPF